MELKSNKGLFLQIADSFCNQILDDKLRSNDSVSSVQDLASELGVSRNIVVRAYNYLQDENIFTIRQAVGFFVTEQALELIKEKEKITFFENEVPLLLEKIRLLKLNSEDLQQIISEIKKND